MTTLACAPVVRPNDASTARRDPSQGAAMTNGPPKTRTQEEARNLEQRPVPRPFRRQGNSLHHWSIPQVET
jgi:hypothetical protein